MSLLQGLQFPDNGVKVFQEDWNFEQDSKANELLNTRTDSFTDGILSGGEITNGVGQSINIQPVIAYDIQGKRIETPLISNQAVPLNKTNKVVIRHKFEIEIVIQPDSTNLNYQKNSYEILFRETSLLSGDILLFEIQNSSGVTTILRDMRIYRKVKDDSLLDKINIAERFRGIISGRLKFLDNTKIIVPKFNFYDIKGEFLQIKSQLDLDFTLLSNIFRDDGSNISSIVEIQNKHLYLLVDKDSRLTARIIAGAEMQIGTHSYNDNPKLIEDFYSIVPNIFSNSTNGYYKLNSRIIAVLRINSSNQVEFFYELGNGYRFMDVQHLGVGQKFTELRWKREHPNCYIPDGSTITNMSSEAPELFKIYGTNILPDFANRFARNIGLGSSRNLRDTQEDAFQGFKMASSTATGAFNANGGFPSEPGYYGYGLNVMDIFLDDGANGTPRIDYETRGTNYGELDQIVRA